TFHQRAGCGGFDLKIRRSDRLHPLITENNRPDKQAEVQRLGHGRGLEINQIGVSTVDQGGQPRRQSTTERRLGLKTQCPAKQAKDSHGSDHIGRQGRNGPTHSAAPERDKEQKWNHEQVRERQPCRSQLQQAGSARIEHPACDVDVCYGIAVKQNASVIEIKKDRKSTRLNSSHVKISYAVFCLKKKK